MGIYLLPITCENTWILVDCVTYNGISNLIFFSHFCWCTAKLDASQTVTLECLNPEVEFLSGPRTGLPSRLGIFIQRGPTGNPSEISQFFFQTVLRHERNFWSNFIWTYLRILSGGPGLSGSLLPLGYFKNRSETSRRGRESRDSFLSSHLGFRCKYFASE